MSITPTLVMNEFPDFNEPGFDIEHYNKRFHQSNVVIRTSASSVDYPLHWGPRSVKCSFKGEEHYETGNSHYAADDEHFLVFNHGILSHYEHQNSRQFFFDVRLPPRESSLSDVEYLV